MKTAVHTFLLFCVMAWCSELFAKRAAPKEVTSVTHAGIQYQVVHSKWKNGQQNGGYLQAIDTKDGKKVWGILVYVVEYDPELESDVQDCFINSMRLSKEKNKLIVTNEVDDHYYVDLKTQRVVHFLPPRRP